jgi:preprotein translocase subunit SecG
MFTVLIILYILICIFLVIAVLVQSGRGSDIGAVFGGGATQTIFGPGGTKTVMTKITIILFVLFALLSILLSAIPQGQSKLLKKMTKEAESLPQPVQQK